MKTEGTFCISTTLQNEREESLKTGFELARGESSNNTNRQQQQSKEIQNRFSKQLKTLKVS